MTLLAQHRQTTWHLEGFADEEGGIRAVPVAPLPFLVGRRSDLSLCLPFAGISKLHAELYEQADGLWLRDLDSTNGTFLNGERVTSPTALKAGDIVHFADREFRVDCRAPQDETATIQQDPTQWLSILTQFDRLFDPNALVPYYQPIVDLKDASTVGYEVLGRSRVEGLRNPKEMFAMAERLKMQGELSRIFRREGVRCGDDFTRGTNLFLNTHPSELPEPGLIESLEAVRKQWPTQALTLEIHEAAVTECEAMRQLRAALTSLNIQLAYDDFGAGQARLTDLVEVPPDYLKFDICLIRDIHIAPARRQQMLATLVKMVRDLGIAPLAEGIETAEEATVCRDLGFEYAQGYYFGRPAPRPEKS